MSFFDVDFELLGRQLLPVKLRLQRFKAWIQCQIAVITFVYNLFVGNRSNNLYHLAHNSQIPYMEAVLNDTFDPTDRGIYIGDGPYEEPTPLYLDAEERPLWLALDSELPVSEYDAPIYLFTGFEMALEGYQFIVYYPDGLTFDMARMRALIEKYRLPGKNNYNIQSYI